MGGSVAECSSVEVDSNGVSWCVINNDRESQVAPDACESAYCAVITVTYDYALPAGAGYCEMEFTYDCYHSLMSYADWVGADGNSYLWQDICGGVASGGCECDTNDATWRSDSGTLTSSTYGLSAFAPAEFRFGDLGNTDEAGYLTLGPLRCHE